MSFSIAAGKHVLVEWPLASRTEDAVDLASRVRAARVRGFVGLQARFSPVVAQVKALVEQGFVGRVDATSLVASGEGWGPEVDSGHAWYHDRAQGTTVLEVSTLHALDGLAFALGEIEDAQAITAVRKPKVRVVDTGQEIVPTAPDQVVVGGRLSGGALLSVHYRGGTSRAGALRWEINGSEGDLLVTADGGNLQVAPLRLAGGRGADTVVRALESETATGLPAAAVNVSRLYAALARDLRTGSHDVPDFEHAVSRHRLADRLR